MLTRTLNIECIQLNCIEQNVNAKGAIVFIHGNSSSSRLWTNQFTDPSLSGFHLIAFDLPAHGNSGSAADMNMYSATGLGALMGMAVKAVLHNKPFIVVGFSFGSNIVAELPLKEMHCKGIALISSCIIGSGCTLAEVFNNATDASSFFTDEVADRALDDLIALVMLNKNIENKKLLKENFRKVKAPFRSQLLQNTMNGMVGDEIVLLQQTNIPLLVVMGKQDAVVHKDYLDNMPLNYWRNTIFKLDNANHFIPLDQPAHLSALLSTYAVDIFSK